MSFNSSGFDALLPKQLSAEGVLGRMFDRIEGKDCSLLTGQIAISGSRSLKGSDREPLPFSIDIISQATYVETKTYVEVGGVNGKVGFCKAFTDRENLADLIDSAVKSCLADCEEENFGGKFSSGERSYSQ